jgi:glycosyltransferase involved in cell wall biosynthesis
VAPWARRVAKRIMPYLMRRAAGVIVTNELLRDEYARRYGVEATIVRNPCDWPPPLREEAAPWPEDQSEIRIVYTGSIYEAQLDAFVNFIEALRKLGRSDTRLDLYTSQSPEELAARGISGPIHFHEHVSRDVVRAIQRRSDLLFLPLAFDSPYEKGLIETSAPGKMAEYLASGRPILVYAPSESFVASYFREHGCGAVVDHRSVDDLSVEIGKLLDDGAYRERLTQRARERAVADFDLAEAQRAFRGALRGVHRR